MTKRAIESVTFTLAAGVSKAQFLDTVAASTAFIAALPGFVSRRLSCTDDGTWIEHIEWRTLKDARAAAAAMPTSETVQPFLRCIDGTSIVLRHAELETSVN